MMTTHDTDRGSAADRAARPTWLSPTPLADDGAPMRVPTTVDLTTLPERTPVLGSTHDVEGVTVREVTFVVEAADDVDVMVHLNGLTDNHRQNIEPALLRHVPATTAHALTYLLPDDGTWSYRFVTRDHLAHDVGAERPGWVAIHADGRPDPLNPERLPHPHGEESSVLRMPGAPTRAEWPRARPGAPSTLEPSAWRRVDLPELPDAPGTVACHHLPSGAPNAPLLVLFDAEQFAAMPLAAAMARYRHDVDVLLIESGSHELRGQVLPHPERVAGRVQDALDVLASSTGETIPPGRVIISGVSYGGLAAAGLVVHHPEIAERAIVQSGSFWFDPAHSGAPGRDMEEPGALTRCLSDGPPRPGRTLVVTVGTDEGTMAHQARLFTEAADAACMDVRVQQYRGGHDWAWWSHALFDGLDELLD